MQTHRPFLLVGALLATVLLGSCRKAAPAGAPDSAGPRDFVQTDDISPADQRYLDFARPAMMLLAARDYAGFHALLSPEAQARMSLNQFDPAEDDAEFARREQQPERAVAVARFQALCTRMEQRFGSPTQADDLHVHSTEAHILAGQAQEAADQIDILFAIGSIPPEIPVASRRASLRGRLLVALPAAQLEDAAKLRGVSVERLRADPEFRPYLNVKLVLVETGAGLRIGYFEFLPPSMMD